MKTRELMIGNILHNGTITEIGKDYVKFNDGFATWNTKDMIGGLKILRPLQLTEIQHNKFGVKKNGFGNFEYDICPFGRKTRVLVFSGDYLYTRDMSGKDRAEDDLITIWNKDIKKNFYVHEWQNLYFALSGKELKRKKKIK